MSGFSPSWIPYGPSAILYRFPEDHERLLNIAAALEERAPADVMEYIPGLSTLLLIFATSPDFSLEERADSMLAWMDKVISTPAPKPALHEIPVIYNGPDLASLATHHGLSIDEVVAFHSGPIYRVQMLGFSPGFPYLGPLDSRLHTPRLPSPRNRVASGSVAIGGPHTGIYTVETAGGWHILGHTKIKIFDPDRSSPHHEKDMFLLLPGDQVRFLPSHE